MVSRKKIRIGDLLVDNKLISQNQLEEALAEQKKSGRKLGKILIENGYIEENRMLEVLSEQLKIPFVDLQHYKFNSDTVKMIPEIQARRFRAIALANDDNGVLVGMADPTDIFAYDEISRILNKPVRAAVVRESDLLKTIDLVYRKTDQISGYAEELSDELAESDIDLANLVSSADVAEAPVVKLLQSLFEDAVQIGASDIHIEPDESVLRLRQRVDGVLQEHIMEETRIASALVLRLKLMAGLDISERRLPQAFVTQYRCAPVHHAGLLRRIGGHASAGPDRGYPGSGGSGHAAAVAAAFRRADSPAPRHGPGDRPHR